ncbi:DUF4340 domain-containing protein [Opitutaceae bacterium]|nr:DUF4340 domain-containing protein [Opitutaceae bacterium]MDB4474142.1 DUF4340 domain-containing protein [Opitutaceae bacterium]
MRTKITLFLLLLNVVLFFFIFGVEREWQTERLIEESRSRVLGPEAANIQSLQISGSSLPNTVQLERNGESWRIIAPYEWPANPHAVSRIINELQFLEHYTSFTVDNLGATDLSLADYGLDNPNLTVTFRSGSGETAIETSLVIGDKTKIGQRLYVLSPDGSRVHVVPDSLANSLSIELEQLRTNACFTIPVFEVRSLNLQNDGPANVRVRLRRENNRWRFESPVVTRASKAQTEVAVSDIATLRTAEFLGAPSRQPELLTTSGTNTPSLRITLEGNNRRETLLLGSEVPAPESNGDAAAAPTGTDQKYYAQMEGRDAIFTVTLPERLASNLRNAQRELREATILELDGRQIDSIALQDDLGQEIMIQKLDTNEESEATEVISPWQVVNRESDGSLRTFQADTQVVEDELLRTLRLLRAETFERDVPTDADLEEWGLKRPRRTITISFQSSLGGNPAPDAITLLVGTDQPGDNAYAKTERETFVYSIDDVFLRNTPLDPLHYRERLLRELPAGARITGLQLRDLSNDTEVLAQRLTAEDTWETVIATQPEAQRTSLTQLLDSLRTLRAQRIVADKFSESVSVNSTSSDWRYQLEVRLSLSGDGGEQEELFTLFLADRDGGDRQLVGSPSLDLIFEASPELIRAIWNLTYADRDPGAIELTTPPEMPDPEA